MKPILPGAALLAAFGGAALAEPAPGPQPLTIVVRPSSQERAEGAQEREERLQRRMQRNDFLFRHICRGCGGGPPPGGEAAFNPAEALAPAPRARDPARVQPHDME